MRSAHQSSPRPRHRALALALGLLLAAGGLSACSNDGPPSPSITGGSPTEVTTPTVPPATTEAPAVTSPEPGDGTSIPTETTAP